MAAKLDVSTVMAGRIVEVLRASSTLNALLFSKTAALSPFDYRIYIDQDELPEGPIREVLPRILVASFSVPFETEQPSADSSDLYATVGVTVHSLAEAKERDLAERLNAEVRDILVSTPLSNASIIASGLVPESTMRPMREVSFRNAWRYSTGFRAQAGVL
jgi:hypothetical protein